MKEGFKQIIVFIIVVIVGGYGLGNILLHDEDDIVVEKKNSNTVARVEKSNPSVSPTPLATNAADFLEKWHKAIPTPDPDEPVHCQIPEECGGGTTPLKRWECNQSICCNLGSERIFLKSDEECIGKKIEKYNFYVERVNGQKRDEEIAVENYNKEFSKKIEEYEAKYNEYLKLLEDQEKLAKEKEKTEIDNYNNQVADYCNDMANLKYPSLPAGTSIGVNSYVVGENYSTKGQRSSYYNSCLGKYSIIN